MFKAAPDSVADPGLKNRTVPLIGRSDGLVRITCVVQPPPSAKWGRSVAPLRLPIGTTGSVVIRNSPRSFVKPRRAITPTGTEEVKLKVPITERPLNGALFRNPDICWF